MASLTNAIYKIVAGRELRRPGSYRNIVRCWLSSWSDVTFACGPSDQNGMPQPTVTRQRRCRPGAGGSVSGSAGATSGAAA